MYIGLPVTCQEAYRLFDLNYEETILKIMQKHHLSSRHRMSYWYLVDELNNHFVDNGLTITLFYTDRGQCIIGYEIKELSKLWKKNMTVDRVIHILADAKTTFERETQKYADNFKTVTLEHRDDEPEIVHFPVPYMIEFV